MSAEQRDRGLNAARGLAVLSILTAQLTPDAGPFRVLMYAEFLPPALLAVLIGMTAQVAREHGAPAIVNLLWGAALIVLGGLISLLPGDVVPLLGYLGCLAVVTTVLVRLPVPALAGAGVALLALAPWATARLAHLHSASTALSGSWADRRILDVLDVLAGDSPYRVLALTTYAIAGVLLVRLVDTPDTHGMVVGAALVVAMGVDAVSQAGGPVLRFGVGTVQELSFNTAVAVAVAAAGHWAGSRARGAAVRLTETLADIGGMWLSIYVLMVLGTAGHVWIDPLGERDRSWATLGWSLVAAVTLASVWVRVAAGTRMEQGPLEGPIEALAGRRPTLRSTSIAAPDRRSQSLRSRT